MPELSVQKQMPPAYCHITRQDWLQTPSGAPRGYIQPQLLEELWFHTGTICNLRCPFCLEGAGPGNVRLGSITLNDARPFIAEALDFGVKQFSFTGGEPFAAHDFIEILDYALERCPCLVLTNATDPLIHKDAEVAVLKNKPHPLKFRVSLDYPVPARHDANRGQGNFQKALDSLTRLYRHGFAVSVARKQEDHEEAKLVDSAYRHLFAQAGLPPDVPIIAFPDFLSPGSKAEVPQITENCLRLYKDEQSRARFMCNFSKMVVKKDGRMCVYACTLVDDDPDYDLGKTLAEAMKVRIMLKHHRCYACFAGGASCSETQLSPSSAREQNSKKLVPEKGAGMSANDTQQMVRQYYGNTLQGNGDLKTNACCCDPAVITPEHRKILADIAPEILEKFYGCGSPIPPALEGKTVLDLGCGTGRDVYLLSRLVGKDGFVIGVDMTDAQLEIARRHLQPQMQKFGYSAANVAFRHGYIEDMQSIGIEDASMDVVISNCVINLSPNKHRVFSEIFRVLKPGGELYFSDIFSDRRVPHHLLSEPVLRGECLAGCLYVQDFRRLLREVGCLDYRVVSQAQVKLKDPAIERQIGMIGFFSMTIRAFKLELEDICEDYGQVTVYLGNLPGASHRFVLDDHHIFTTHKPMLVCGNTAAMLQKTRFAPYFKVTGDRTVHFGKFDCQSSSTSLQGGKTGCCC